MNGKHFFAGLAAAFSLAASAQQTMLPDELKTFVLDTYPNLSIRSILPQKESPKNMEVTMEDASAFVYDKKLNVISVGSGSADFRWDARVCDAERKYVAENFPENRIVMWSRTKKAETLVLDNGVSLQFSTKDFSIIPVKQK